MKQIAKVKGVGDRLWVTVDSSQRLDALTAEVDALFNKMKSLSTHANVVVDTGGDPAAEGRLVAHFEKILKERFDVSSVTGPPKKEPSSDNETAKPSARRSKRVRNLDSSGHQYRNDAMVLAGRIRSGQSIKVRRHLVILGDVNPGAEVAAGGDILIMGSLCGKASAGYPDNTEAIVLALDLRPTQLQIGGLVAAGMADNSRNGTEFARIEDGHIVVENYLEANPFKRIQWPEFR